MLTLLPDFYFDKQQYREEISRLPTYNSNNYYHENSNAFFCTCLCVCGAGDPADAYFDSALGENDLAPDYIERLIRIPSAFISRGMLLHDPDRVR